MSAPVDVLKVLEETSFFLRTNTGLAPGWRSTEVKNARDAVAELIEAAEQAHSFLCEKAPATATEYRLRTALARVRGAA